EKEASFKLLRIRNKTTLKGRKLQLNFHDGRNLIAEMDDFGTNDVVVFDIEKKSIRDKIRFDKGSIALIIKGR
ncbi:MAG: 30S ribosomal protein S4e, partial [Candidatus Aenigmarchaeota archaeon]|nr:30S ribosomal protein S4e [Candidatus Aenigmarchaeota archaeon]MDI6722857.1 30S ribosomal protein S4e [Candidatus Aenigmarchaeota archaeon]